MNRNELIAYVVAAVVGGAVAGHIAGLIGTLGVFAGVGLVGYAELIVLTSRSYQQGTDSLPAAAHPFGAR